MRLHYRPLLIAMFVILLAALGLNLYLFNQGRRYYIELNETRLDPLGLSNFPAAPSPSENQQPIILW